MPFSFESLAIPDIILIKPTLYSDERGFFVESYRMSDFSQGGITSSFIQDNHSRSKRGVLRGLHYQLQPHAQGKLVRVARGEIFDVAVDIRKGSATYGKWVGAILSESNDHIMWVPAGFAHGFLALTDVTDVLYKTTAEYAASLERGILWSDPAIGIVWPMTAPLLSPKDAQLPLLANAENSFFCGETS